MTKLIALALLGAALAGSIALAQPPTEANISVAMVEAPAPRLTTASPVRALLTDPEARGVLARHAPQVVEFFASGQGQSVAPADTPLAEIARFPQARTQASPPTT